MSSKPCERTRWCIFVRPSWVHLAGRHVGDIIAERHRDILGRRGGPAQMHGDVFGHDDLGEHTGAGAVLDGGRAAAASAGKKRVDRDDHRFVRDAGGLLAFRQHLQRGQRDLPGEDLDALDAYRPVALLGGDEGAGGVRQHRDVGFVQRIAACRGLDGKVRRVALAVGHEIEGEVVAAHNDRHLRHRGGLPRSEALDAQSTVCHSNHTPLQK